MSYFKYLLALIFIFSICISDIYFGKRGLEGRSDMSSDSIDNKNLKVMHENRIKERLSDLERFENYREIVKSLDDDELLRDIESKDLEPKEMIRALFVLASPELKNISHIKNKALEFINMLIYCFGRDLRISDFALDNLHNKDGNSD